MNGNWRDDEEKLCFRWRVAVPLIGGILNIESMMMLAKSDLGYKVPIGTYKVFLFFRYACMNLCDLGTW